ncbi:PBSX family phage terminase large subunit [Sporosarcina psychrophila]|uniref:Phage terminase large subunit n=2 Tax=Sporosarcina psychrophila TaxID=1476 RepID=A0ABV2KBD0_SPOPS
MANPQTNVVNILDLINTNFYSFWLNDKPHSILSGGRSSMKSSVISLKLVIDFLNDDQGNVVCLRKVGKYLAGSVYEQIKWAIYMLGVQDEFIFGKSPLIIKHKRTGTGFYFHGVDDPLKLKSMNIAQGYYMALWFEELAEFAGVEDIDVVEDTFIRQDLGDKNVKVYYSYNPPRNPYSWVNEWKDSKVGSENYFLHHSTYLDDEKDFLSKQMIEKIDNYKENDEDYWNWMYGGLVIGMGDNIYNMNHFQPLQELPNNDPVILIDTATDSGHQQSATTHGAFALTAKKKVILLDTYYYSPAGKVVKKAPSELSDEYKEWLDEVRKKYKKQVDMTSIDSAEGALRNQLFKDHGIRLHPIAKGKKLDMIDYVYDLLAQGRFYYLETSNNQVFIEEHRKYQMDADSLRTANPKVVEIDDHTCDMFQYYVMDNRQKLGLKF